MGESRRTFREQLAELSGRRRWSRRWGKTLEGPMGLIKVWNVFSREDEASEFYRWETMFKEVGSGGRMRAGK